MLKKKKKGLPLYTQIILRHKMPWKLVEIFLLKGKQNCIEVEEFSSKNFLAPFKKIETKRQTLFPFYFIIWMKIKGSYIQCEFIYSVFIYVFIYFSPCQTAFLS